MSVGIGGSEYLYTQCYFLLGDKDPNRDDSGPTAATHAWRRFHPDFPKGAAVH